MWTFLKSCIIVKLWNSVCCLNFIVFHDKSTINVFVISGRFSEKYWILSSLSAFSQASKLLKHKQMKILLKLRLENIKLEFRAITLRFVNPNLSQIEHKTASEKWRSNVAQSDVAK